MHLATLGARAHELRTHLKLDEQQGTAGGHNAVEVHPGGDRLDRRRCARGGGGSGLACDPTQPKHAHEPRSLSIDEIGRELLDVASSKARERC